MTDSAPTPLRWSQRLCGVAGKAVTVRGAQKRASSTDDATTTGNTFLYWGPYDARGSYCCRWSNYSQYDRGAGEEVLEWKHRQAFPVVGVAPFRDVVRVHLGLDLDSCVWGRPVLHGWLMMHRSGVSFACHLPMQSWWLRACGSRAGCPSLAVAIVVLKALASPFARPSSAAGVAGSATLALPRSW